MRGLLPVLFVAWGASVPVRAQFVDVIAECPSVTYTWGTKYPSCDLDPPDRLHVLGIGRYTCSSWGGAWGGSIKTKTGQITTICYDVDY
jgi:hypothetical protein